MAAEVGLEIFDAVCAGDYTFGYVFAAGFGAVAAALLGLTSLKGFPKGFAVTFLLGVGGAIGF